MGIALAFGGVPAWVAAQAQAQDMGATLSEVRVDASAEKESATAPVVGYRARNAATATKTDTPLAETPQSVTVVTRDQIVDQLIEKAKIPVSDEAVKREVDSHLENEGKAMDDPHRVEVLEETDKNFRVQLLLDAVVDAEAIKVEDQELIEYLAFQSRNYGMDPNEFIKQVANAGQVPMFVDELSRRKAVDALVAHAEITDAKGNKVSVEG